MTVSYLTTRPLPGPPYTTSVDAALVLHRRHDGVRFDQCQSASRPRGLQIQTAVWSCGVVVPQIFGQHSMQLALIPDVGAHGIPGACAHVFPQVVGPVDRLTGGLLGW